MAEYILLVDWNFLPLVRWEPRAILPQHGQNVSCFCRSSKDFLCHT